VVLLVSGNIVAEKTTLEADPDINLEMAYQAANRLATVDDFVIQFDADGNMTRGPLAGELTNFGFDSRNRLVQAGDTVYNYDAENQRIGVNQIQYVVNSQPALSQVLVKTEVDGTQIFYVYGLGLIGQEKDGEYLSYHFDFRGSTVALTDETAQISERFQYSPYGLLLNGDASRTPFLRLLSIDDLGIEGIRVFHGNLSVSGNVVNIFVGIITSKSAGNTNKKGIRNFIEVINRLSQLARAEGATTLRIKAYIVNLKLKAILKRRYNMTADNDHQIFTIPLD